MKMANPESWKKLSYSNSDKFTKISWKKSKTSGRDNPKIISVLCKVIFQNNIYFWWRCC